MPRLRGTDTEIIVQNLRQWPDGYDRTPPGERVGDIFQAERDSTIRKLDRQLQRLDAEGVVLQIEAPAGEIRQSDGLPYKRADVDPGVVLTFENEEGTHTYPADAFDDWEANLRAIANTLHNLWQIERWRVGRGSEQYRGYVALPEDVDEALTPERAARELVSTAGYRSADDFEDRVDAVLEDEAAARRHLREAQSMAHPDRATGNDASFKRVQTAGDVLRQHHAKGDDDQLEAST